MVEKLKNYIENRYKDAEKNAKTWRDIENWRAQAYGALMFCLENDYVDYDEVTEYWETMWNKFWELDDKISRE